jgi:hypothetical protein
MLLDLDKKRPPFTLMNNLLEYLHLNLLFKPSFLYTMFAIALLAGCWHDKEYLARNPASHGICSRVPHKISLFWYFAVYRAEGFIPFFFVFRSASSEVDAQSAKVASTAFLRCSTEDVGPPRYLKVHKFGLNNDHVKLYFQQSAGNSASPEIDLVLGALWHRLLHQDVADL